MPEFDSIRPKDGNWETLQEKYTSEVMNSGDCKDPGHATLGCPGPGSDFHEEQHRLDEEGIARAFRNFYVQPTVRNYAKDRRLSGKARKKARRNNAS